ncbi:helix-turn-helix domain-containing protein [Streptomyces phaeofaciens]|uniref:helix-turn-helix domain-containing protein n=1 Tax=Streptomyces phaeofaciens TaxID=68254 RepID=UPI00167632C4|nr:helix-turn-helix transcriptional regulator [Streptomyces phaeofaciens]
MPDLPFDAPAARRLRAALGLTADHVAHTLRTSYGLPLTTLALVAAWERGAATPTAAELTALAGVLWCSPAELLGRPGTLREHRLVRGLAAEDVARAVGHELPAYLRMEEAGRWRGTERQSAALAEVLGLTLPDLVAVTGAEARLAELLRAAVGTRWQAHVRAITKIVPLSRRLVEDALHDLHEDYQRRMVPTLSWGDNSTAGVASDAGRDFLDGIVEHFWSILQPGSRTPTPPRPSGPWAPSSAR